MQPLNHDAHYRSINIYDKPVRQDGGDHSTLSANSTAEMTAYLRQSKYIHDY